MSFYRVRAAAESELEQFDAPHQAAEATLANNQKLAAVDRPGGPYRVLYVSGRPNWEFKFLRRAAEAETKKEQKGEEAAEEKTFKSGNLGLQALNPEISVTGDMLGRYQSGNDEAPTSETVFRTLGLHFEAYLDPYSRFKAAIPISVVEAELGEAYFTRYGVAWNINLTLGKFRQQFGVVNRWHMHALDWFDFPLALTSIFGPGGLKGRLKHHLKKAPNPRWHIDYLRMESLPEEAWVHVGKLKREHIWASSMGAIKGASVPAPGFGSSDCGCRTHLFHFKRKLSFRAFEKLIPKGRGDSGKPHRNYFKPV